MKNRNFWLKIPVMALVFGFFVAWSLEAQTDRRLNGRWAGVVNGGVMEWRFNNENYESSRAGVASERGTYTAINGELTVKPTHIFGGPFASKGIPGFESKWYTINEFIIAFRPFLLEQGVPEREINQFIQRMISLPPVSYSVDSNTLILINEGGTSIFTKK
jgi:hypothetical protein